MLHGLIKVMLRGGLESRELVFLRFALSLIIVEYIATDLFKPGE